MKSKFTTFILTVIMLLLIVVFILFGLIIYMEINGESDLSTVFGDGNFISIETAGHNEEKKSIGETITEIFTTNEEKVEYSEENSIGNYFYNQLSDNQKIIYNGLQENKENMKNGTYIIKFGEKFSELLSQENGKEELGNDYQAAVDAYTHDNVDLFYLDVSKMYITIKTSKKVWKTTYDVYIAPEDGKTYYSDNFTSEQQVRTAINKIENIKNNIINQLTGYEYKDIKKIHDYLIDNIEYDQQYKSKGTHSIYGAFLDKTCVCEGYAKAFKYLADSVGIKCVLMQGTAKNSTGKKESHAWNAVCINNIWYNIDCTWDDPIIIGSGAYSASINYRYFLKGKNSFEKDHTLEYEFSDGGKKFSYPSVSLSDYENIFGC